MLGTCVTFSATAPLARTKKCGASCGGANVKINYAVTVAQIIMALIHAISGPKFARKSKLNSNY